MRLVPTVRELFVASMLGYLVMILVLACGCKSTQNLSHTEQQARLATVTQEVRLDQPCG